MTRVDFHAHIVPGADHGCDSLETGLAQLALAEKAGVTHIVATPHFYPDRSSAAGFFQRRERGLKQLREAYRGPIRIITGAEVFLCEGLQHFERLRELCIEESNTILIELPNAPWPQRYVNTLHAIRELGLQIVLAHIERYPGKQIDRLLQMGLLAQVNAPCLCAPLQRGHYRKLMEQGSLCAVGSDIHDRDGRSYKAFAAAMRTLRRFDEQLQRKMCFLAGCDEKNICIRRATRYRGMVFHG